MTRTDVPLTPDLAAARAALWASAATLTAADLAFRWGVAAITIRKQAQRGALPVPHHRVNGRDIAVYLADVEAYERDHIGPRGHIVGQAA